MDCDLCGSPVTEEKVTYSLELPEHWILVEKFRPVSVDNVAKSSFTWKRSKSCRPLPGVNRSLTVFRKPPFLTLAKSINQSLLAWRPQL